MTYLITQTFVLLLAAALLGLLLGWYLTRIAASSSIAALQARLRNAEHDARELRAELDAATTARTALEGERQALQKEIAALQEGAAAQADDATVEALQGELAACREALAGVAAIPPSDAPQAPPVASARQQAGSRPAVAEAGAEADDLQRIKGIGPKIAGILHDLGINRFAQIADWSPANVAWVNDHLKFKGRVEREAWIAQARELMRDASPRD